MTRKKTLELGGRKPSVEECVEAWWRVIDVPAGRILPDTPHGQPGDVPRFCDVFDLYCWRLVVKALDECRVRGIPPTNLAALVAHRQRGGRFSDFPVFQVVKIDPDDPRKFHSKPRPVSEIDRLGIDEAWIARTAYAKFRKVLQATIDRSEPYIPPARADMA